MNKISLSSVQEGATVCIKSIDAGKGITSHLVNLGLMEGELIKVYRNVKGNLIIGKDNFRLALGRGMSHKILVEYPLEKR
jgi:ferrous iron transport protein A